MLTHQRPLRRMGGGARSRLPAVIVKGRWMTWSEALGVIAVDSATRRGGEAVVLAGSELAPVPVETWRGLEVIDCVALHVGKIAAAARAVA